MKTRYFIPLTLLFSLMLVRAAVTPPPSGKIILSWDYPTNLLATNLTFKIYTSTDLSIPITNWTVLANIAGTNLSAQIQVTPGAHFFAMTASNFWGESDFSEVISTPALPRSDVKLSVRRGD